MEMVWARVSVSLALLPLNQPTQDPECAGWAEVAWVMGVKPRVDVWVQGVVVDPFSNPGLASNWAAVQPPPPEGVTVNEYVAECDNELDPDVSVPVTVIGYVPAGVEEDVPIVNVADPPAVTEEGLNDAVAPAGRPLVDNATDCADPDVTVV